MMAECRGGVGGGDCLIKLFGKTIPVPEAAADAAKESGSSSGLTESDAPEISAQQEASDPSPQPEVVDAEDPKSSPETTTRRQQPGAGDAAGQREKLKKPDKVLPCPRCNSMDTKFCYFNNYNVNQPRHFCKNCQRYWTAGGAMRNVPVGAGRRKNKHAAAAASHFLQRVRAAAGDPLGTHGGTVLSFAAQGHGHGAPPALHDLAEQVNRLNEKLLIPASRNAGGNPSPTGPRSEGSSSTDDDKITHGGGGGIKEKPSAVDRHANGAPPQHPVSMNGAAVWPYSCAPSPAYFSSGIAIPIYPAAPGYWGCMIPAGAWSMPWPAVQPPSQQGLSSPTSTTAPSVSSSGAESLTLGKHPREVDDWRSSAHGSGGKVWAPKTIRIDDADEVARSSIWSLIGIKGDSRKQDADHAVGHKHGTVFEPKLEAKKAAKPAVITSSPPPLHANPVALTRSVTFQEGS